MFVWETWKGNASHPFLSRVFVGFGEVSLWRMCDCHVSGKCRAMANTETSPEPGETQMIWYKEVLDPVIDVFVLRRPVMKTVKAELPEVADQIAEEAAKAFEGRKCFTDIRPKRGRALHR